MRSKVAIDVSEEVSTLKSCPFCGGENVQVSFAGNVEDRWDNLFSRASILCIDCHASGPVVSESPPESGLQELKTEAAQRWNELSV